MVTVTEASWVEFSIPSTTEHMNEATNMILRAMARQNWQEDGNDSRHFFAIRIALEELLVNAIKHGNGMQSELLVFIGYKINDEEVIIRIRDCGEGFNPDEVPDATLDENLERPSGRGLMITKAFATSVDFVFLEGTNRTNHITFTRHRMHPPMPLGD